MIQKFSHLHKLSHPLVNLGLHEDTTPSGPKYSQIFSVSGAFGSAIHVEYVDFAPALGWQFWSFIL